MLGPIPLEEAIWVVLYSPAWGLTMAFLFDLKWKTKNAHS